MAKGVRSKTEEKASSFLVEVTGMALILFSLLAFLCVITGESLFWNAGKSVRNFMYGVFGAYTFVFLIHLTMFGVRLVIGKSLISKDKRLTAFVARFAIYCVFAILHLSISYKGGLSFGEELGAAFNMPKSEAITVGGAFTSLVSYPLALIAAKFGAIVFFSIALLLSLSYLFRTQIAKIFVKKEKKEKVKAGNPQKKSQQDSSDNDGYVEKQPMEAPIKKGFFFNENAQFAFKTKREVADGVTNDLPIMRGVFEPKNLIDETNTGRQTVRVRTQAESSRAVPNPGRRVNVGNAMQSPVTFADVSDPIPTQKETSGYEDSSISKDVYTIPVTKQDGYSNERFEKTFAREQASREQAAREQAAREQSAYEQPVREQAAHDTVVEPSHVGGLFDNAPRGVQANVHEQDVFAPAHETTGKIIQTTPENIDNSVFGGKVASPPATYQEGPSKAANNDSPFSHDVPVYKNASTMGESYKETEKDVVTVHLGRPAGSKDGYARTRQSVSATNVPRFEPKPEPPAPPVVEEEASGDGSIGDMPLNYKYKAPKIDLLFDYTPDENAQWKEREHQAFCKEKIISVYKQRGIDVSVVNVTQGPTVTRFDLAVPDDVSLNEMLSAQKDLGFRLRTSGELVIKSIPKTDLIGIEIASEARRPVGMKEVMQHKATSEIKFENGLYFMLGQDVLGEPIYFNLMKLPHLLISGATGTGKSVCLNVMLTSLMYRYSPEDFRIVIIDPKIVEFAAYKGIPHLVFDEILGIDNRAIAVLDWAVDEMERRYQFLADNGYKDILAYNKNIDPKTQKKIPYLIILIDEFADFVQAKQEYRKKIEIVLQRLAQKARAAGISLICATQRPSADVFSSAIKTNIPSRICFKTSSQTDSRVVIDENGAEKLLSAGDCLYKTTQDGTIRRGQCAFIDDEKGELRKVIDYVKTNNKSYYDNKVLQNINNAAAAATAAENGETDGDLPSPKSSGSAMSLDPKDADDITKRALRLCIVRHSISTSALRTYLGIGYNKAATIVLWLERMKYISEPLENKMRKPLITKEQYEEIFGEEFVEDW